MKSIKLSQVTNTMFLGMFFTLLIAKIFVLYDVNVIMLIVNMMHIILHVLIFVAICSVYKKLKNADKSIALWFFLINIQLIVDMILWHFSKHGLPYIGKTPAWMLISSAMLWDIMIIVFTFIAFIKYILGNSSYYRIFFVLFAINIFMAFLFLLSVHNAHIPLSDSSTFRIAMFFLFKMMAFDFIVLCLINTRSPGLMIFLSGLIILILGDFFVVYAVVFQKTVFHLYAQFLWPVGLWMNFLGIIFIREKADYQIRGWFRRYNTIRSLVAFWSFVGSILSLMIFFVICRMFSIVSQQDLLIAPLLVGLYSLCIMLLSLYFGDYFERPFKTIEASMKSFMDNETPATGNSYFSIEEFVFLEDFILSTFKSKQKKEQEHIKLKYQYTKTDLDNLKIKESLLQEQINFEREKSKADILQLQIDNHKITELEQERFHNVVQHVVHDIRSPLNTINNFITTLEADIKEKDRINLRLATRRLAGIAGNLLNKYRNTNNISYETEDLLVASSLLQIISEKEVEYNNKNIAFEVEIDKSDYFAFIKINGDMFKRMISNLINNAVEALDETRIGKINIKLRAATQNAVIFIEDNGLGMPEHVVDSFKKGIAITHNKDTGNGVGLVQVYNTIKLGNGECDIYATKNVGTEVVVQFPKTTPPQWLCSEIKIKANDEIIILDDDASVHGSWDKLLENLHHAYQNIKITHFLLGKEALEYINQIPLQQQKNILFLSDYELLKQDLTGLDVIKQVSLSRVVLVTSYSSELSMQNQILDAGIKMLPKELIAFVPVKLSFEDIKATKKVDFIWLEDQDFFVEDISSRLFSGLNFDVYSNPDDFLNNIELYPTDTKIILDMFYETKANKLYNTNGIFIAKNLFRRGYTKLYLLTGEEPPLAVPDYLKVILKNDDVAIQNLTGAN